jgi:hypothetical protein
MKQATTVTLKNCLQGVPPACIQLIEEICDYLRELFHMHCTINPNKRQVNR